MSGTPRTDALRATIKTPFWEAKDCEALLTHARDLELENAQLKADTTTLKSTLIDSKDYILDPGMLRRIKRALCYVEGKDSPV